ncbi:hypothetical protein J2S55_005892 [Streptosporangium brasiliense]|uniref:Uncharacterized protein n=1 Tax=Streptosporangium brasiliense TaxID=47480 RepID=A0ABT9RBJ5_9ACTN|nr:hypothetical protein [Streptosporangium brasiliense]MDP9866626.1 hypothetical protein [Streptosporangium brasiliense]
MIAPLHRVQLVRSRVIEGLARHMDHPAASRRVDVLAEGLDSNNIEAGLLQCFPYSGLLAGLALASGELPQ